MGGGDPSDDIISKEGGGVFQAVLIVAPLNTDRYHQHRSNGHRLPL